MSEDMTATNADRMSDAEFSATGGLICPFCRSKSVQCDDSDMDGPEAYSYDSCGDCGRSWKTVYTVSSYTPDDE